MRLKSWWAIVAQLRCPTFMGGLLALWAVFMVGAVMADWGDARCDIYAKGEDRARSVQACVFYQAQGHIVITLSDGKEYDFMPQDDDPGHYRDSHGADVYQEILGEQGMIFRLPDERIQVYWDTSGLPGRQVTDQENKPFSTQTLDAVTAIICTQKGISESGRGHCPVGVLRGPGRDQAILALMRPDGLIRLLRFEGGRVQAHGKGKLSVESFKDEWRVRIDDEESYRVPVELINGD